MLTTVNLIGSKLELCCVTFNALLQLINIMCDIIWLQLIVTRWELISEKQTQGAMVQGLFEDVYPWTWIGCGLKAGCGGRAGVAAVRRRMAGVMYHI